MLCFGNHKTLNNSEKSKKILPAIYSYFKTTATRYLQYIESIQMKILLQLFQQYVKHYSPHFINSL